MNKKKIFVVALAICLVAIVSLGTLAWFTDEDQVTNNFYVAGSDDQNPDDVFSIDVWEDDDRDDTDEDDDDKIQDGIKFDNILPGDDLYKEVNVENTGAYDQYVRVIVTVSDATVWQDIFGEVYVSLDEIATDINADFEYYNTVYDADENTLAYVFYYKNILPVDGIATVFTNVHIPEAMDRSQAAELAGQFDINVVAQAVQTENVGNNAIEAFETVGMGLEAGEKTVATTPAGLWAALNANIGLSLTADIDMTGYAWTPVRSAEAPYTAIFDGAGYTISNLALTDADAGMFAAVENGTVKNVDFEDVSIGGDYAATVAYYAENATFENIKVLSGSITSAKYGAGVVFEADQIVIKDCVNHAKVNTGFSASGIGAWILNSTVEGCENYGDITGANRAGGICANFSGTVSDCKNDGNVTSTGSMPAGGIVGVVSGATTIENCTNNGDVTTTADNVNASAAGILAQTPSAKVTIKACTNNGKITAEQSHAAGIGFSLYGGITAEGCTNTGVIAGADGTADIVAAKGAFGGKNTIK